MSGVLFVTAGTSEVSIAAAVRAALAAELARLDVTVSSRATPADVQQPVTVLPAPTGTVS